MALSVLVVQNFTVSWTDFSQLGLLFSKNNSNVSYLIYVILVMKGIKCISDQFDLNNSSFILEKIKRDYSFAYSVLQLNLEFYKNLIIYSII